MIAIISDVHGNYPALSSVLKKIDEIGCDKILSLGDVSGYYCMVNECIEEFRNRKIINILGNHDSYILGRGKCSRSTTVNNCIEYQKKIITSTNMSYLASSWDYFDDDILSARHGGWNDPIDEYFYKFDFDIAHRFSCKLFCSGHNHIQSIQTKGDVTYFNPGSVGQPRDNDPRAAFAVIDDMCQVRLYRVEYDIDDIFVKMKKEGFEERITECLYSGTKIKAYEDKSFL